MRESLKRYVRSVNTRRFTNNVQKVLFQLLVDTDDGEGWVRTRNLKVKSADSRVRDLRKPEYGSFRVNCRRENGQTSYRLTLRDLTVSKLRTVFKDS
jgi:hypothetical protein